VRLIEGPRINASAARNRALAVSTGDYIQYLDADDLLEPGKIRRQLDVLEANPRCVAFGRWGRFAERTEDVVFADDDELRDWTPVGWLEFALRGNRMMHPAAWLVPRDIASAAGPWDESLTLNDDGEYFARVVCRSDGLKCVPDAVSFYRTTAAPSLSKSRGTAAYASLFQSVERTATTLLAFEDSPRTRRAAADLLRRFRHYVYPAVPELRRRAEELVKGWGGSDVQPDLGPKSRLLSSLVGRRLGLALTKMRRRGAARTPWSS
jgi:glycosyltransferase involved in cell wall biosynthesis